MSNIITKSVFGVFLYLDPLAVRALLNYYSPHKNIIKEKFVLLSEINVVCDHL